jgi:hypothetical protein
VGYFRRAVLERQLSTETVVESAGKTSKALVVPWSYRVPMTIMDCVDGLKLGL